MPRGSLSSHDAPTSHVQMVPEATSGDSSVAFRLADCLVLVGTSKPGNGSHGNSEEAIADRDARTFLDPIHGGVVPLDGTDGLNWKPDHPRTLAPEATSEDPLPVRPPGQDVGQGIDCVLSPSPPAPATDSHHLSAPSGQTQTLL